MNSKKLYTLVKKEIPSSWISSSTDAKVENESSSANMLSMQNTFMTIYSVEELKPTSLSEKLTKKNVSEYDKKLKKLHETFA